jgi:hypothetical protein
MLREGLGGGGFGGTVRLSEHFSGWKDHPNGQKRGDETFRGILLSRVLCKKAFPDIKSFFMSQSVISI